MADVRRRAEITKADIDRVDAVDEPATGIPFLMLKAQADPNASDPANVPEALVKADGEGDSEDTAHAGDETIDAASSDAYVTPGSAAWEAVDADNARYAVANLLAVRQVLSALIDREQAEAASLEDGDDLNNLWNLDEACGGIDCAIGILATFAATEQQEADNEAAEAEAQARALGLIKRLNLTNRDTEEPAMAAEPTKAELLKSYEADAIAKALEAGIEDASLMGLMVRKAQNEDLPTGVIDLLNQIVAVMNAIDDVSTSVDEAAESPVDTGEGAAPEVPEAEAPIAEAADIPPAAPASAPDDTPAGGADSEGTAPEAPATDGDEPKPNPFAKSADPDAAARANALAAIEARQASIRAAVDEHRQASNLPSIAKAQAEQTPIEDRIAAAVAAAIAPLQKRITELEETPVETGILLSGHVPGTPGPNTGQGKADMAQADLLKAAAATGDTGKQMDALVEVLKGTRRGVL